jgi:hypothetical protein
MDYATAKAHSEKLYAESVAASRALEALSGPKGRMGLTPDSVKATSEWKAAKHASDAAFAALRKFNATFVRRFAKEIARDRRERGR